MACGGSGSGCQSDCYRNRDEEEGEEVVVPTPEAKTTTSPAANDNHQSLCIKCKANETMSFAGRATGDDARFCADCFRSNLFGKFRLAVTSNAMICPTDNVLVAFSGGPSSRSLFLFFLSFFFSTQFSFYAVFGF